MRASSLPALVLLLPATLLAAALAVLALAVPEAALVVMPLLVLAMLALLLYEIPMALVAVLVAVYGLALDVQLDMLVNTTGGGGAGGVAGLIGSAVVKVFPFLLTALLCLRYGFSSTINWPFLAFTAVAAVSLVVLPIGRISTNGEMVRSFIGSTAPFVLAFAQAPRNLWSALCKSVIFMPLLSAAVGLLLMPTGLVDAFDPQNLRFQGLHSPPFLAGFAITAIFACTLEYLRNWQPRWLVLGCLSLAVLLLTQARTPFAVVVLFLLTVMLAARGRVFPLKRKIDLAMGGMLPALVVLGPVLVFALDRILTGGDPTGAGGFNFSGRDVIWPYFVEAIEARPLFGYGLGAGKLLVDPEDPAIRLIRSNAAHNEYLRLSVDAGIIGCTLIFASIIAWIWTGTARLAPQEKTVLRASLLPVLLFCATDNTLIAGMGVVLFIWYTAAMARSRAEQRARPHGAGAPQWRGVQRRSLPRSA
jgi:O-antigen ligase